MKRFEKATLGFRRAFAFCVGALFLLFAVPACKKSQTLQPQSSSSQATNTLPSASFKEGGKKIGEGAQQIGRAVGDTAVKTWDSVKTGTEKTGDGIKEGAQKTGEAIKDTAQKIGDSFKSNP